MQQQVCPADSKCEVLVQRGWFGARLPADVPRDADYTHCIQCNMLCMESGMHMCASQRVCVAGRVRGLAFTEQGKPDGGHVVTLHAEDGSIYLLHEAAEGSQGSAPVAGGSSGSSTAQRAPGGMLPGALVQVTGYMDQTLAAGSLPAIAVASWRQLEAPLDLRPSGSAGEASSTSGVSPRNFIVPPKSTTQLSLLVVPIGFCGSSATSVTRAVSAGGFVQQHRTDC